MSITTTELMEGVKLHKIDTKKYLLNIKKLKYIFKKYLNVIGITLEILISIFWKMFMSKTKSSD